MSRRRVRAGTPRQSWVVMPRGGPPRSLRDRAHGREMAADSATRRITPPDGVPLAETARHIGNQRIASILGEQTDFREWSTT